MRSTNRPQVPVAPRLYLRTRRRCCQRAPRPLRPQRRNPADPTLKSDGYAVDRTWIGRIGMISIEIYEIHGDMKDCERDWKDIISPENGRINGDLRTRLMEPLDILTFFSIFPKVLFGKLGGVFPFAPQGHQCRWVRACRVSTRGGLMWRCGSLALCLDTFQSLPLAPACDCEQIPAMTQGFRCDMQKNRIDWI